MRFLALLVPLGLLAACAPPDEGNTPSRDPTTDADQPPAAVAPADVSDTYPTGTQIVVASDGSMILVLGEEDDSDLGGQYVEEKEDILDGATIMPTSGDPCAEEDLETWYPDDDCDYVGIEEGEDLCNIDGVYTSLNPAFAADCYVPSVAPEYGVDCDDADDAVNPSASEVCDGVDNDCVGGIDMADNNYWEDSDGDGVTWNDADYFIGGVVYPDADTDGYGDSLAAPEEACEATDGFAMNNYDCDDTDGAPIAYWEETCVE